MVSCKVQWQYAIEVVGDSPSEHGTAHGTMGHYTRREKFDDNGGFKIEMGAI